MFKWVLTLTKWWFCILIKIKVPKLKGWWWFLYPIQWWFLYPIQGFSFISSEFNPHSWLVKLFAWLFKVITFTNCIHHFPSLFHSFYYHPHPFPSCPLHQKARKPTRNQELSSRAKLGIFTFRGSKLAWGTRAPRHDHATLSRGQSWVLVFFGVRLVCVLTSHWPLHQDVFC